MYSVLDMRGLSVHSQAYFKMNPIYKHLCYALKHFQRNLTWIRSQNSDFTLELISKEFTTNQRQFYFVS